MEEGRGPPVHGHVARDRDPSGEPEERVLFSCADPGIDDDEAGAAAYFFFWSETAMAISTVNYKRVDPVGFYAAVCHRL